MDTSKITAEEIMTDHLVTATPEMHVLDAIERLLAHRVSGLPVVDDAGRLVGRFSERSGVTAADLAPIGEDDSANSPLNRISALALMSGGLVLQDSDDVFSALSVLLRKRVSGSPVVRQDGTFLGVFSEASAMHVFIGLCWEQMPSARLSAWLDDKDGRSISEDTGLSEVLSRFQRTRFRRLMVVRDQQLIGQLTRRDALHAAMNASLGPWVVSRMDSDGLGSQSQTTVQHWMLTNVPTVSRNMDVLSVAQTFIESGVRQLPVVDNSRLIGQISRSDLLRAVQRQFPDHNSDSVGAQLLYLSSVNKKDPAAVVR